MKVLSFLALSIVAPVYLTAASPAQARTWYILPDGTGDAPTIHAALDSATAGDVIELACGTYYSYAIEMRSGITLRSETGEPDCATIDGQYPDYYGAIFQCWSVDNSARIEGLTITGGKSVDHYFGHSGGGLVLSGSDLGIINCRITGNLAYSGGGVVVFGDSHPTFVDCEISQNEATNFGGGVLVRGVFIAYGTTISANVCPEYGPDGFVSSLGEARFHCCTFDPAQWDVYGTVTIDDENCDPVRREARTWGGVKALYR